MNEIIEFFDKRAEAWDKEIIQNPTKINYLISLLNLKDGSKVLDVGCGTGILENYFPDFINLTAIDFSSKMINIAKSKFPNKNFLVQDFLEFNSDEKFDAIMMYNIFPHFLRPYLAFNKAYQLLKEGGKLLICHGEGREKINGRHSNIHNNLSIGLLPTEDLLQWMLPYFEIEIQEDKPEYFALLGRKIVR